MKNKTQEALIPNPVVRFYDIDKCIYNIHQQDNIVYAYVERDEPSRLYAYLFKERAKRPIVEKHIFPTSDYAKNYYNLLKLVYFYQNGSVLADSLPKGDNCFIESCDDTTRKKLFLKDVIHPWRKLDVLHLKELKVRPCVHSVHIDNFVWSLLLSSASELNDEFYSNPIAEILMFESAAEAAQYYTMQHHLYRKVDFSEPIRQNQKRIDDMNQICQLLQQTKQGKMYE
jgi:hypothetical protein